jgi:GxxExxY protein
VEDSLIIEAKAVDKDAERMDYYKAQILTYMKLLDIPLGLVINFHNPRLGMRGIRRVILKGANIP